MGEDDPGQQPAHWTRYLDDREIKHAAYCREYATKYAHGAPGHIDLMLIAKLTRLLDCSVVCFSDGTDTVVRAEAVDL